MALLPPDPPQSDESPRRCTHPRKLVVCGECGVMFDEPPQDRAGLGEELHGGAVAPFHPGSDPDGQALWFIVARGHPELVENLRAMLGATGSVRVIEDRRRASRTVASSDDSEAPTVRTDLRRRILREEPDPGA